jgi:dolichol-phosphate mannosyltransferase
VDEPPRVSVVVPTWQEGGNVGRLIRRLGQALADVPHEIVVVDDDSNDGTRREARDASRDVRVIHREHERGLSSAVVRGFEAARGTYVCVMDADLQHPPEAVPDLLDAAQWGDHDLVVGSRFREDGDVVGFPLSRRIVSWGARSLTQAASPRMRDLEITDPVSGFFLVRRNKLDLDALEPRGYKILLEVLHRGSVESVTEVGFTFRNRANGDSNLTTGVAAQFLLQLANLAAGQRDNQRLAQFATVGLTGVFVNLLLLTGLTEGLGLYYVASATVAVEASILVNFALNDAWTFRDRREGSWWQRCWRFNAVSLAAMGVNLSVMTALTEFAGVHYAVSQVVGILVAFIANYAGNLSWTYLTREASRADAEAPSRFHREFDRLLAALVGARGAEGNDDEPP